MAYTPSVTISSGNLTRVTNCTTGGGVGDAAQWIANTTPIFDNRQKTKTVVTGNLKKNNIMLAPESDLDGETQDTFLSNYMSVTADASATIYEDQSTRGVNAGDVTKAVITLTTFGKNQPSGKRKTLVMLCEPNSKGYTGEALKATSPSIEYTGVKATRDIGIPAALFPTDLVTGAVLATIPAGQIGFEVWLTSAN